MKLYQRLASLIQARENCAKSGNTEWYQRHSELADKLAREYLPSGSGFDNASTIYLDESKPNKLVLATSFHHMDDNGMYNGWTEHKIIVTPDLALGFDLGVTGRDRNDIKQYIAEMFSHALDQNIDDNAYRVLAA